MSLQCSATLREISLKATLLWESLKAHQAQQKGICQS